MFLESILFLQKLKNFKNSVTLFWRLSRGSSKSHDSAASSRVNFWRLVRKWKVQLRGVLRDFRGSAHDSLVGRPSSREKHLENFSQFCLWLFSWLDLATCWWLTSVAKNVCLTKIGSVFKSFQFSLEPFLTIHFLSQLNLTQTLRVILYKLHCWTCTPLNLQEEKVWTLILSPHISYFASFSWVFVLVFWFLLWMCFDDFRFVLVWII